MYILRKQKTKGHLTLLVRQQIRFELEPNQAEPFAQWNYIGWSYVNDKIEAGKDLIR